MSHSSDIEGTVPGGFDGDGLFRSRTLIGRPRRSPQPVVATPALIEFDQLKAKGIRDWKHYHHERKLPFDWSFASIAPALGRAMLETVYSMSGVNDIIESQTTAQSYQINTRSFFKWLSARQSSAADKIGVNDTHLPPSVWQAYRSDLDLRVAAGEIRSKTAYQYKGTVARILQRIWFDDPYALGPGWHERSFVSDGFDDDTKQREPYSAAEARRILESGTGTEIHTQ